jgi:hypothetical protein
MWGKSFVRPAVIPRLKFRKEMFISNESISKRLFPEKMTVISNLISKMRSSKKWLGTFLTYDEWGPFMM